MELIDFIKKIKEEFPDKAIDMSESLELVKTVISDTVDAFGEKISLSLANRNFNNITIYSDMAKVAHIYENKIEELMSLLEIDEIEREDEKDEDSEKDLIPNYEEYIVDTKVEHTLYENFTHKRPYGFKLNDRKIVEVRTWQDMLIKTCEILIMIDEKKFLDFENNNSMNGKKIKYFSINPENMRKPKIVNNKIYVEMNQSGNAIRNLIIKLLKEYNFKINEYKVYFRADYSNLNESIS